MTVLGAWTFGGIVTSSGATLGGFVYNDGVSYCLLSSTLRVMPKLQEILEPVGRADRQISLGGYFQARAFALVIDVVGSSAADAELKLRTLTRSFSPRHGYQRLYGGFLGDAYLNAKCVGIEPALVPDLGPNTIRTTLRMLAPDGMRYASFPTTLTPTLSFVHLTGTEYRASFSLATAGSEVGLPVYTVTLTGSAYTVGSGWLVNASTGQTITILAAFAPGDVIAIDVPNSVVNKNGVALTTPFYGIMPGIDPTLGITNVFELHLLATGAPTATASMTYTPRFLD